MLKTPNPGSVTNAFSGVAVTSATNAWAVGNYSNSGTGLEARSLIAHWNGTAWKQQPSPSPGSGFNALFGVAATSATNAWAVGRYDNGVGTSYQTLIVHWNGTGWKQVPAPDPGGSGTGHVSVLYGAAAISASNAWAVGYYSNSTTGLLQTLIVHWNGTAWKQVSSPNVSSTDNQLTGVAATSATNAWAVGASGDFQGNQSLIMHWNGTAWKQVSSPSTTSSNILSGVTATSSGNAWAVGSACMMCGSESQVTDTLTEHWNGTVWQQVSSPSPGNFSNDLHGVAATSATNAWAVGAEGTGTLAAQWNGSSWKQVPTPGSSLSAVTAPSSTNIWAVGFYSKGTLALHRC